MLTELSIRNLAIVDAVSLEYQPGLSVFTGETGAGKSIIVDALSTLMGGKIEASMIRSDSDGLDVTACFDTNLLPPVQSWLQQQGLNTEDDECLLRRLQPANGRGRGFINGRPVPLAQLRELASQLIEIHGQHAHQALLKPAAQRQLIDNSLAGNDREAFEQCQILFNQYKDLKEQHRALSSSDSGDADRLDYLTFLISELRAANLQADELKELGNQHQKSANASSIALACNTALAALYEEDNGNAYSLINQACSQLESVLEMDAEFASVLETAESAKLQVEDCARSLRALLDQIDLDPNSLEEIESRLAVWHELARKHRCDPEELPAKLEALQEELNDLQHREEKLAVLDREIADCIEQWQSQADLLSKARKNAATAVAESVTHWLQQLGMPAASFNIAVTPESGLPRSLGQDSVQFLLQANPGQAEAPLEKAASGGELSRTGLALKVSALQGNQNSTLIFDEVDSGIGGETADAVGRLLAQLGEQFQVLVVTHLPQVAAHGDQHYQVRKEIIDNRTFSRVDQLENGHRTAELARMLSGNTSDTALAHAQELLKKAS